MTYFTGTEGELQSVLNQYLTENALTNKLQGELAEANTTIDGLIRDNENLRTTVQEDAYVIGGMNEENIRLMTAVEELESENSALKLANGMAHTDHTALQGQIDELVGELDDAREANSQWDGVFRVQSQIWDRTVSNLRADLAEKDLLIAQLEELIRVYMDLRR